jgi:hypothetical protein
MKVIGWIFVICIILPVAFCAYVSQGVREQYQKEAQLVPMAHDSSPSYGVTDIDQIVDTDRNNSPRFKRDYFGRRFDGYLPFRSASEGFGGQQQVHFGQDFHGVYCFLGNEGLISQMANWKMGTRTHVQGIIESTNFGEVWLQHCAVEVE